MSQLDPKLALHSHNLLLPESTQQRLQNRVHIARIPQIGNPWPIFILATVANPRPFDYFEILLEFGQCYGTL